MKEIWKDVDWIKGYEGLYKISNFGNVVSKNYRHTQKEHEIKAFVNKHGYFAVVLRSNGKQKNLLVHRLVATAFLNNPNELPLVNHKDENKKNNRVDNLEWCTQKYNLNYSLERRNRKNKRNKNNKTKQRKPIKYFKKVYQISLNGKVVAEHKNVSEAARTNGYILKSLIECCKGNRKTAYGYKWEFAD